MNALPRSLPLPLLFAGAMSTAFAHHSAAPHYDLSREIQVSGIVDRFEFVNPHGYVYFTVQPAGGAAQAWRCELAARAALARLGWSAATFAAGQNATFKGAPARREEHVCMLTSFVRADGVEVDAHANLISGGRGPPPLPVVSAPTAKAAGDPAIAAGADSRLVGLWVPRDQGGPGGGRGPGAHGPGARGPGARGPGGEPGARGAGAVRGGPPPAVGADRPQPTAAGRAAARDYDQRFDDPAVHCSPANILFGWMHDQNVNEIRLAAREVTLKYGYMDLVRTVHLDAAEHPRQLQPSLAGHSTGRWEGGVLVVDTVGFTPGVLDPMAGIMHSAHLHVVERFWLDATGNVLTRGFEADDDLYLASPWRGSDVVLRSSEPATPYDCVELSGRNNQRPQQPPPQRQ